MKKHFSKFKKLFSVVSIFVLTMVPLMANAVGPYYFIRPMGADDTIYFDNSSAGWSTVRIYMYNSTDNTYPYEWVDRPTMTSLTNDIWEYSISVDDNFYNKGYDYIVFSDDSGEQTINLGFVGDGYAYKVDAWQDGLRSGYWYLYDKSGITFYNVRALKTGDTIYFDTTGTDWEAPKIYFFSTLDGGSERFTWDNRPSMEYVSGTIYKYVITPDLDIESYLDNYVIFSAGNNNAQTINLGFIDTGYAYKIETWQNGDGVGYWYVYDKTSLVSLISEANNYLDGAPCTHEPEYALLLQSMANANVAINNEVPVETEVVGNTEEYWNQVDSVQTDLQKRLDTLENACPVDPDNPDTPDTPDDEDTPGDEDSSSSASDSEKTDYATNGNVAVPDTGDGFYGDGSAAFIAVDILCIAMITIATVLVKHKIH